MEAVKLMHGRICGEAFVKSEGQFKLLHPVALGKFILTNQGKSNIIGEKHYLSPELTQIKKSSVELHTFCKADVFSLGLLAIEMASLEYVKKWYDEKHHLDEDLLFYFDCLPGVFLTDNK
jgi:serine/threonine protein kinase